MKFKISYLMTYTATILLKLTESIAGVYTLKSMLWNFFGFEHVKILGFPKGASFALKM